MLLRRASTTTSRTPSGWRPTRGRRGPGRWIGDRDRGAAPPGRRRRPARVIGPLGHRRREVDEFAGTVDLDAAYTRLRLVKSAEEIEWIRRAAELTDAGVAALREAARPGVTSTSSAAAVEARLAAARRRRPTSTTSPPRRWPGPTLACRRSGRRRPARCRPATCSSARSARSWWEYPGAAAAGRSPSTPSRRRSTASCSHGADAAFDAVVVAAARRRDRGRAVEAAGVIEDAGSRSATTSCTASSAATFRPSSARRPHARSRLHLRGRHDGGRPAERGHARRARRRADRRAAAGDRTAPSRCTTSSAACWRPARPENDPRRLNHVRRAGPMTDQAPDRRSGARRSSTAAGWRLRRGDVQRSSSRQPRPSSRAWRLAGRGGGCSGRERRAPVRGGLALALAARTRRPDARGRRPDPRARR